MKLTRQVMLVGVITILIGGVTWIAFSLTEQEPVYEGKPLDVWLLGYRSVEPSLRKKAVEITDKAGTNAIPTLLRMLKAHDTALKHSLMSFLQKQSSYRISYVSSEIRNCAAANACEELGDKAKPCVPALIVLNSKETYVRSVASNALVRSEPEANTNTVRSSFQ
jgi:hypothetical protein